MSTTTMSQLRSVARLGVLLLLLLQTGCAWWCNLWGCCRPGACTQNPNPCTSLACQPGTPPGPTPSAPQPAAQRQRVCRGDAFFVEVPLETQPPWQSRAFAELARREMTTLAQANPSWFEPTTSTLVASSIEARVDWVLGAWPTATVPAYRSGGEDRFLRYRFETKDAQGGTEALMVKDDFQCSVVEALRLAVRNGVYSADGVALPDFTSYWVGRECDAIALSTPTSPFTAARKTWHIDALEATSRSHSELRNIDIAVIDTNPTPFAEGINTASHGTAVEHLIRELAPDAAVQIYPAIEPRGFATTNAIAQALDEAVFNAYVRQRPTVINLSLGWPSHKSIRSPLSNSSGSCTTWEDPVGESVKYVLDVAHRVDSNRSPIAVVSAAGNRWEQPREEKPGTLEIMGYQFWSGEVEEFCEQDLPIFDETGATGIPTVGIMNPSELPSGVTFVGRQLRGTPAAGSPGEYGLVVQVERGSNSYRRTMSMKVVPTGDCVSEPAFPLFSVPAEYDRGTLCRFASDQPANLSWAVGSVDHRFEPSVLSVRSGRPPFPWVQEPDLLAPGDYVYVGDADSGDPVYMSGTSLAAAQVTAMAAQAQARLIGDADRAPFKAPALKRLLMGTGRDCRGDHFIPSLDTIAASMTCQSQLDTCESFPQAPTCRSGLSSCVTLPACTPPGSLGGTVVAPTPVAATGVPADYTTLSPPAGITANPWVDQTRNFDFPLPPNNGFMPDFVSLGSAGPQPTIPDCTSCLGQCGPGGGTFSLYLNLNPALDIEGLAQADPTLVVTIPGSEPFDVGLGSGGVSPWCAGTPGSCGSIAMTVPFSAPSGQSCSNSFTFGLRIRQIDVSTGEYAFQMNPLITP